MTAESSRASAVANGKKLRSVTQRRWSLAISLNPELHLAEGSPFSLLFFSHLWAWLCQSLAILRIVLPFLLPRASAGFTSVQAIPSRPDRWLQISDPGISVTYLDFHSEDLPAPTRRQISEAEAEFTHLTAALPHSSPFLPYSYPDKIVLPSPQFSESSGRQT